MSSFFRWRNRTCVLPVALAPLSFYSHSMQYNPYSTWVPEPILFPDKLSSNSANIDCFDPNTIVKCLPCTSASSKRILLNCSTSPLQRSEKSKTFTTPDHFAVYASDVTKDNIFNTPSIIHNGTAENIPRVEHKVEQVLPINIKVITNIPAFDDLTKITIPNKLTYKSTPSRQSVRSNGRFSFNHMIDNSNETNTSHHTFLPRSMRSFWIITINLCHSTLSADIYTSLSEKGHVAKQVHNFRKKNNRPLPIYFVSLKYKNNNNDIFNITSLLNIIIAIEKRH